MERQNEKLHVHKQEKSYCFSTMNTTNIYCLFYFILCTDPGFQVRGGALKKNAPSGGRHENFWEIGGLYMVEFNIYVMFKLCKLFFNLIRSYMIIINHTFIIANRVTLLK
jgi:hypothetical protein